MSATWFAYTAPDLLPILRELLPFEPIFHTRAFGFTSQPIFVNECFRSTGRSAPPTAVTAGNSFWTSCPKGSSRRRCLCGMEMFRSGALPTRPRHLSGDLHSQPDRTPHSPFNNMAENARRLAHPLPSGHNRQFGRSPV